MSGTEIRILRLERELQQALDRLSRDESRLAADEQQLANLGYNQGFGSGGGSLVTMAILTSSLATGTFASPASASANLYRWTGTAWIVDISVTVYSSWVLGSSISSGKKIGVFNVNGGWHVLTAEC